MDDFLNVSMTIFACTRVGRHFKGHEVLIAISAFGDSTRFLFCLSSKFSTLMFDRPCWSPTQNHTPASSYLS